LVRLRSKFVLLIVLFNLGFTGLVLFSSCSVAPRFRSITETGGLYVVEGTASYYADEFHGRKTASGEIFDMYALTAAHKTFPLGTIARVTNLRNNREVIVKINDRGPFVEGRILDLSYGAAEKLDFIIDGLTEVRIEVLEWGDSK